VLVAANPIQRIYTDMTYVDQVFEHKLADILIYNGYATMRLLAGAEASELLKLPGMGRRYLKEIRKVLAERGRALKGEKLAPKTKAKVVPRRGALAPTSEAVPRKRYEYTYVERRGYTVANSEQNLAKFTGMGNVGWQLAACEDGVYYFVREKVG
jgi:hypothetical protein